MESLSRQLKRRDPRRRGIPRLVQIAAAGQIPRDAVVTAERSADDGRRGGVGGRTP